MFGLTVTILSVISTIVLAGIVFSNNRRSALHVFMFLLSLGLAGSIGSNYFTTYYNDSARVLWWIRWTMFFAALAIPSWYLFLRNFPKRNLVIPRRSAIIVSISALIVMLLAISPWMFTSVTITNGNVSPQPGFGLPLFFLTFIIYLILLGKEFIHKFRSHRGMERAQLIYILIATIVSFVIIIIFNVLAPLVFHSSTLVPLTNIAPLLFTGIVAYAIIRHRLMDIRVILRKTSVYVANLIIILLAALLLYRLESAFFKEAIPPGSWGPLVLLFSLVIFNPLKRLLEKIANKYFFTSLYNYQATLEDLGKRLTFTINLAEIVDSIITTIKQTMHLDRAGVLLYYEHTSNYQIYRTEGFTESNGISLVRNNFLTNHLIQSRKPILYQELESLQTNGNGEKSEIGKLKTNMKRIEASLCLPLIIKNKLIGIIVLGEKISHDAYTKEDLDLLTTLSNQAAVAIDNASSYQQVQDFTKTLQQKVDEQTKDVKKANTELKRMLEIQSSFLDITSHQLRTPVSVIKGFTSMMVEGELNNLPKEKQKEFIQAIRDKSVKLEIIIHDILTASELETIRLSVKPDSPLIQLEDVADESSRSAFFGAEQRKMELIWKKPEKPLARVKGEARWLEQAISNLINNALKYTPSLIEVKEARNKRDTKGIVEVSVYQDKNDIVVKVKDNGIGIPKEDIKGLFTKFVRATNATNMYTDGSGLGLWIVKKIVDGHKGRVWAESEQGKGSEFFLSLPIAKEEVSLKNKNKLNKKTPAILKH